MTETTSRVEISCPDEPEWQSYGGDCKTMHMARLQCAAGKKRFPMCKFRIVRVTTTTEILES